MGRKGFVLTLIGAVRVLVGVIAVASIKYVAAVASIEYVAASANCGSFLRVSLC